MKHIKTILVFFVIYVLLPHLSYSQPIGAVGPSGFRAGFVRIKIQGQAKVKLISGEAPALYGMRRVKIQYDRDSMQVCDYESEAAYLEYRCENKDSATSEAIKAKWFNTHIEVCEPNFEEYFNRNAAKIGLVGINNSPEQIPVLLVKVKMEEPHHHTIGWNTPPYIVMECWFFDTSGNRLAVFELSAVGSPNGDIRERLRDCYAIAGKLLSKELVKLL